MNDQINQLRQQLADDVPGTVGRIESFVESRKSQRGGHTQLGLLCEEAGLMGLAFREFQLALRDDPVDPVACHKLAEHFREHGDTRRAIALWERLLDGNPARYEWLAPYVELLVEEEAFPKIEQAVERAEQHGLPPDQAALLRRRPARDAPAIDQPPLAPTDADCVRFATVFAGREDVYARQWAKPQQGRSGYTPVHEPLTPAVIRNHLLGTYTVGVYPIRLDGTANWFVVDLDICRPALDRARRNSAYAQSLRHMLARHGPRLLASLRSLGFAPLFENSGYKGRHYWVILQDPEDASVLHRFGRLLASWLAAELPSELHLEFFPKQARRSGKGLGNLIKLPLGIHRWTGYRSLFLDDQGAPLPEPLEAIQNLERCQRSALYAAVDQLKSLAGSTTAVSAPRPPHDEEEPESPQVAAPPPPDVPLPWTEADFDTDRHVRHLLSRCPVLAELKHQVDEHRRLSHDEQVVLVHTLGHLPGGPQAVNYLFSKCVDVAPERHMKSALRGNPMSCPKIRKRIGHVTRRTSCNCCFEFAPDRYPTPVLHLLTLPAERPPASSPSRSAPPAGPGDADQLEGLARRFGVLERRRRELEQEWKQLHDALCSALRQLPDRSLTVETGRYRLIEKDGVEELIWDDTQPQETETPESEFPRGQAAQTEAPGAPPSGPSPVDPENPKNS